MPTTRISRCVPLLFLVMSTSQVGAAPPQRPPTAPQDRMTPEGAVRRLFTGAHVEADWFAPSFLAQVSADRVETIIRDMTRAWGPFRSIQRGHDGYETELERGTYATSIALDEKGRFTGLMFQSSRMNVVGPNEAALALPAFPGKTSLLVITDGADRTAIRADDRLAVGSSFKLVLAAALQDLVVAKKRKWSDVVALLPAWRSLPSGILQTWPDGSFVTVQTLATLMISQSDNTAADAVLDLVGRTAVENISPTNRPFFSTRDLFVLKGDPANADILATFRGGNEAQRRVVLASLASRKLPAVSAISSKPTALDIEWFVSARELCHLMVKVHALPFMGVTPGHGVVHPTDWDRVAYKGGSEPGVLNLTTWVSQGKHEHCISATWNDDHQPLNDERFIALYAGIIALLHAGPADTDH